MSSQEAYVPATVRWFVVGVVAAMILLASVVRPGQGVAESGPFGLGTRDLWLHAAAYLLLQFAVIYAIVGGSGRPTTPVTATAVFTVTYGLAMELLQLAIAYRSFSTVDIVANAAGVLTAVGCYALGKALVGDQDAF